MQIEFDILEPGFSIKRKIYEYLNNNGQEYDEAIANAAAEACRFGLVRQVMEQREEVKPGKLRGSNAGPCARKIAYSYLGVPPKGKEIDARAKVTFLTGDLLEVVATALTKLAGVQVEHTCLDPDGQLDIEFDAGNGILVPGHPDGIVPVQEGLTEPLLYEVKSVSQWAFENKFERGEIDDGYRLQHNVYLEATGLNKGVFLAINKNQGEICEVFTEKDPEYVEWAKKNYNWAVASTIDDLPPRYDGEAYGVRQVKNGDLYLKPLCTYCSHRDECWPDTEVVFSRSGKPSFRILRLPEDYVLPEAA